MTKTTKIRNAPRPLEPIGEQEMKTVAGGEVGAVMAAMRASCEAIGFACDGAICNSNYLYTAENRCF